MTGSTQTQIVQVEHLLRDFGASHAPQTAARGITRRLATFDGRPIIAAFLAFVVFAPGCAAAAVFLMRADGSIPPAVTPASNPPIVAKTDRLPVGQWTPEAIDMLAGPKTEARIIAAAAVEDASFLAPVLIRGSLEEGTITTFSEPVIAADDVVVITPKPKRRHDVRRTKPLKLVAEVVMPEPPPPTFLEKLFGSRFQ